MKDSKKKVRLYRFTNIEVYRDGEMFAMCDYHKKLYKEPSHVIMKKISDKTDMLCEDCESELSKGKDNNETN